MMKAQPVRHTDTGSEHCTPEEATHLIIKLPGPQEWVSIPVQIHGTRAGTGNWTWNGSTEAPTLRPSLLCTKPGTGFRCHTWITDGNAQFLADCSHELAGQTLPLLDPTFNETES